MSRYLAFRETMELAVGPWTFVIGILSFLRHSSFPPLIFSNSALAAIIRLENYQELAAFPSRLNSLISNPESLETENA